MVGVEDSDHHDDRVHDGDDDVGLNGGGEGEGEVESSCVPCSICLDLVGYGCGERSRAILQCGHQFHLDCIGSAFNVKGMMQCPNCRKIEKGRWLFGSGHTNSSLEMNMNDGAFDHYPFYFSFAEMPYRLQICPYRGLTHVHPSSESNLGIMSTMAPVIPPHQHPGSSPHPHGWVPIQHAVYHHHQQPSSLQMPHSSGAGRFDASRSLPRFMPPGRVYDPFPGFSLYPENLSLHYLHAWGRDNVPHFP